MCVGTAGRLSPVLVMVTGYAIRPARSCTAGRRVKWFTTLQDPAHRTGLFYPWHPNRSARCRRGSAVRFGFIVAGRDFIDAVANSSPARLALIVFSLVILLFTALLALPAGFLVRAGHSPA